MILLGWQSVIDAYLTAHFSYLTIPADVKRIKKEVSIAVGDKDLVLPLSKVKVVQEILKGLDDVKSEFVVYHADLGNEK